MKNFRDGLFMLVSLVTTTGFVTADYTQWSPGLTMFFSSSSFWVHVREALRRN